MDYAPSRIMTKETKPEDDKEERTDRILRFAQEEDRGAKF